MRTITLLVVSIRRAPGLVQKLASPTGFDTDGSTVYPGVPGGLTAQCATMQAENRCKRSANTVLQSSDRCINVNVGFEVGRVEVVMKFPMAALIALTLVGCSPAAPSPPSPNPTTPTLDSPSPSPSPPGPPAATNGWIWAMAVDRTGRCIADATFEIVSGQGPMGDIIRQETPCSVWDYSGGIMLRNLTTGVAMTLRASAPGYHTVERSPFPKLAGTVEEFVLGRQ